jgi:hypothetical protein
MTPRALKHIGVAINKRTQLSESCITGMVEKTGKHYCCYRSDTDFYTEQILN